MSVIYTEEKDMISREILNNEEKISMSLVRGCTSNHIEDHLCLTYEDICNRFQRGIYKENSSRRYSEVNTKRISWFENEALMYKYMTAALNSPIIRKQICTWINLWDKSCGYTFEVCVSTKNANLGKFVTKDGSWKNASTCSRLIIVLQLESMNNVANAGISIKTAYPVPTTDELVTHQKKNNRRDRR